ncbi:MAG: CoB--CoM heterodisulfide reductase iron-sulfur subunit A family protein [Desulfobacterium sp.]|nr:CoB--CoM heterodisulfide reductase iron-sulfur subunit A family protein [Desulfobacterium sp.]MBU3947018.1 FAD-dependent oxidoreductase [Pseudomonadota bacterium]MBU4037702.1 FAD-dependent oxidoreductase [Pseudomonadota bacterium]
MKSSNVLVIGGGIAGLTAAYELAKLDINVELVEKTPFLGGHAARFTCKATECCEKCGACMVEEKIQKVSQNKNIKIHTNATLNTISRNDRFYFNIHINGQNKETDVSVSKENDISISADAVIMATGFTPYYPAKKPYGYKVFDNVITNLELEEMLRNNNIAVKPSDKQAPDKIAFIQCVGSRDSKLNHLWCSKICCASALRMARLIKRRQPETSITIFYIDIQGFGNDFENFYEKAKKDIKLIRAIPADIYKVENERLKLEYFDHLLMQPIEEVYDMVVLSVAITPKNESKELADSLGIETYDTGFIKSCNKDDTATSNGVFVAGTAGGPLSISESAAQGAKTAWDVKKYLNKNQLEF